MFLMRGSFMQNFKRASKAFTLVEVMVAMLILAIGLLGLAGITVVVLRSNTLSQQISDATNIAADLMDSLTRSRPGTITLNATNCPAITFTTGSCPALEQSGINSSTWWPQDHNRTAGGVDCGVVGTIQNTTSSSSTATFDIVASNGTKVQSFAASTDFCAVSNSTALGPKQYFRYYRTYLPAGGVDPARSIIVAVVWKDKRGQWRNVHFSTTQ
jgi:type IV pilus modification protein PilV